MVVVLRHIWRRMSLSTSVAATKVRQQFYKMEMKSFVGKGILFSFVVVLGISGNHAQEVAPKPCYGAFEFAGKILCDRKAECSIVDNALGCQCAAGYEGDAFKLGTGCVPAGEGLTAKRDADADAGPDADAKYIPGVWTSVQQSQEPLGPCFGAFIFIGKFMCEPGTTCLARSYPFEFKCRCPSGKSGNGFDKSWGGSGCS